MKKEDLIDILSLKSKVNRKDTEAVLKAFIKASREILVKEGSLQITGFGTLKVSTRKGCINPQTGEKLPKTVKYVTFTQSEALKASINN